MLGAEALSKGLGEDAGDAVESEEMSSCEGLSLRRRRTGYHTPALLGVSHLRAGAPRLRHL